MLEHSIAIGYLSVRLSVCHAHDAHLNSSTYRNAFCTIW